MLTATTIIYTPVDMESSPEVLSIGCVPIRDYGIPLFTSYTRAFEYGKEYLDIENPAVFSALFQDIAQPLTITEDFDDSTIDQSVVKTPAGSLDLPVAYIFDRPVDFSLYDSGRIHQYDLDTGEVIEKRLCRLGPAEYTRRDPQKPLILFTGTHGSGKSTLASNIKEACPVPYFESYAGPIHTAWGVRADMELSLRERFDIQSHILHRWTADYNCAIHLGGIFDRTPYDLAAYAISEIGRLSTTERTADDVALEKNLTHYINQCIDLMNHIIDEDKGLVVFVPQFDQDGGIGRGGMKAPDGLYATHIDLLIRGLLNRYRRSGKCGYLQFYEETTDLQERVKVVRMAIDRHFDTQLTFDDIPAGATYNVKE